MLGHSPVIKGWLAIAVAPTLAALAVIAGVSWPDGALDVVGIGAHAMCFTLSVLLSLGPLVACMTAGRGTEAVAPRRSGAALGAVAGVWAGLAMQLHCSVAWVPHVLLGHVLPVVLTTAAGFALGTTVLGVHPVRVPRHDSQIAPPV
jgi:hypothetical protein